MSEETYTVEMTGKQAHRLATLLSLLAQDLEDEDGPMREGVEELVPVGKRCAEIAEEADEWEE